MSVLAKMGMFADSEPSRNSNGMPAHRPKSLSLHELRASTSNYIAAYLEVIESLQKVKTQQESLMNELNAINSIHHTSRRQSRRRIDLTEAIEELNRRAENLQGSLDRNNSAGLITQRVEQLAELEDNSETLAPQSPASLFRAF